MPQDAPSAEDGYEGGGEKAPGEEVGDGEPEPDDPLMDGVDFVDDAHSDHVMELPGEWPGCGPGPRIEFGSLSVEYERGEGRDGRCRNDTGRAAARAAWSAAAARLLPRDPALDDETGRVVDGGRDLCCFCCFCCFCCSWIESCSYGCWM
jgi:hypothetical protein